MVKPRTDRLAEHAPDLAVRGVSFSLDEIDAPGGPHLALRALHRPGYGVVSADWLGTEQRRRIAAGRRQPLARAIGLHKPALPGDPPLRVLDATAGLGRDGFTLAALGAAVTLAERQPMTFALLEDALRRARAADDPAIAKAARRIDLIHSDARALLASGPPDPPGWDVIYLDPMYADDGKAALPPKEMQLLRDLTGGDEDADALLAPALARTRGRVVVKRAAKAPWLAGTAPSMAIETKLLRFDVYIKAAIRAAPAAHDFRSP